jgi:hypothetical protein
MEIRFKRHKMVIYMLCSILSVMNCCAQNNKDSAMEIFKTLSSKYANEKYLSFDINYSYRSESDMSVIIDSLSGKIRVNEKKYHVKLGNTEMICDNNYNVILFKEDTLMYLTKPSSSGVSNPVLLLDSMFQKIPNITTSLAETKDEQLVTINFPKGMDYRQAQFFINKRTGYLKKIKYVVKSTQLLSAASKSQTSNSSLQNEWGVVESDFYNYSKGQFNDSEFDSNKYFKKDGTEYKPTDAYRQYKIFIGSPGL